MVGVGVGVGVGVLAAASDVKAFLGLADRDFRFARRPATEGGVAFSVALEEGEPFPDFGVEGLRAFEEGVLRIGCEGSF